MKLLRIPFPTVLLCAALAGAGCARSGGPVTAGQTPAPETGEPPVPEALAAVAPTPNQVASGGGADRARLGIPSGQLPRPGLCRVWIPGVPPGRQALARTCDNVLATAPPGSWVLHRPTQDRGQVQVFYLDAERPEVISRVRVFDTESGRLLREGRRQ
jgi:hypothetical protein